MKFIVVLLLFVTGTRHFAKGERGLCPPTSQPGIGICKFNPEINCSGDDGCKDGQICCPDSCNRVCKDPSEKILPQPTQPPPSEKAGQCKIVPDIVGNCDFDPKINCLRDNECNGTQKCCSVGCNGICQDPVGVDPPPAFKKAGQCKIVPPTFGACVFDPNNNCVGDNECNGTQKCCSDGCNKICLDPAGVVLPPPSSSDKTGQCKIVPPTFGACVIDPKNNCLGDNECNGTQKCCSDGCNKICQDPAGVVLPRSSSSDKAGQCKIVPPTFGACVIDPKNNCLGDNECNGTQKCCSDGCNKICQDPAGVVLPPSSSSDKAGQCKILPPTFGACVFDPKNNCLGDNECNGTQKCCSDGCNKSCQDPVGVEPPPAYQKPGKCLPVPPKFGTCKFDPKVDCFQDDQCNGGQKCCNNGCNKSCQEPALY